MEIVKQISVTILQIQFDCSRRLLELFDLRTDLSVRLINLSNEIKAPFETGSFQLLGRFFLLVVE